MPQASSVIRSDPSILGGKPVFVGTRVPVAIFWEYIHGGYSIDEFLAQYPTVQRQQIATLISDASNRVMPDAPVAR